jgi:hypothetical protein
VDAFTIGYDLAARSLARRLLTRADEIAVPAVPGLPGQE